MTPEAAHRITRLGTTAPVGPARLPGTRIDQVWDGIARQRGSAVAVTDGQIELSYRRLDELAARMAEALLRDGVQPGDLVGVCLERSSLMVVALLAVLKAGCGYLPLDRRYPDQRLRYTTEDAGVGVVIVDEHGFPRIDGVRPLGIEDLLAGDGPLPDRTGPEPLVPAAEAAPAYVIYTSGSTGRPKGVLVGHHNVLALIDATADDFRFGPDDVWTFFHSSAFDFSVWEIWACLLTGGRLVVVPYWISRDPVEFHQLLVDHQITVLNQTPSAFGQLIEADRGAPLLPAIRLVVLGGEPLDARMLEPWFDRYPDHRCRVVNMFGITETTVHVTAMTMTPAAVAQRSRSVGRAIPGWSVSVRDENGRVLPIGAVGEIWVGGAGVASGYLNRPDLTAHRFVVDPDTAERWYRSGDKGRLASDGSLEHLGRIDSQVKVRGHRIELDEIRHVLLATPLVSAAVMVLHQDGDRVGAEARIDAYVVLRPGHTVADIWAGLRNALPAFMVPATVTAVDAIPLTINGKPDLGRLPPAEISGPEPDSGAGPRSGTGDSGSGDALESMILRIWSSQLATQVAPADNFFELGGSSLQVARVLAELRRQGMPKLTVRDFYANSTARDFVALLRRCSTEGLHR
jgi:amino acid adenylation domain-containing protein